MKWKIVYGKSYTKKFVYFGVELSIYLIDKTRIVRSRKNGLFFLRSICFYFTCRNSEEGGWSIQNWKLFYSS